MTAGHDTCHPEFTVGWLFVRYTSRSPSRRRKLIREKQDGNSQGRRPTLAKTIKTTTITHDCPALFHPRVCYSSKRSCRLRTWHRILNSLRQTNNIKTICLLFWQNITIHLWYCIVWASLNISNWNLYCCRSICGYALLRLQFFCHCSSTHLRHNTSRPWEQTYTVSADKFGLQNQQNHSKLA